jgi:hypothetical protein
MKRMSLVAFAAFTLSAIAADNPATTVKLRRLELKTVNITVTGQKEPVAVKYADLIRQVLLQSPQQGEKADELEKVLSVWAPIKKAIAAGDSEVRLNDADYQVLLDHLNGFNWSPLPDAAEAVGDFVTYVRGLAPTDFTATPAK